MFWVSQTACHFNPRATRFVRSIGGRKSLRRRRFLSSMRVGAAAEPPERKSTCCTDLVSSLPEETASAHPYRETGDVAQQAHRCPESWGACHIQNIDKS